MEYVHVTAFPRFSSLQLYQFCLPHPLPWNSLQLLLDFMAITTNGLLCFYHHDHLQYQTISTFAVSAFRCPWHHWDCSCSCWPGEDSRYSLLGGFRDMSFSQGLSLCRVSVEYMIYDFYYIYMLYDLSGVSELWVFQATHYVNMQSLRKSSGSYAGYNLLRTVHCPAAMIIAQLEAPCGRSSV